MSQCFSVEVLLRMLAVSPLPLLASLNSQYMPKSYPYPVGIMCVNTARLSDRNLYRKALTMARNGLHAPAYRYRMAFNITFVAFSAPEKHNTLQNTVKKVLQLTHLESTTDNPGE